MSTDVELRKLVDINVTSQQLLLLSAGAATPPTGGAGWAAPGVVCIDSGCVATAPGDMFVCVFLSI